MNQSPENSGRNKRLWSAVRWFVFLPAMLFMLRNLLMTGSPIPLWSLESLQQPVRVEAVTEDHFVLAGGIRHKLPYIRRIPMSSELLKAAIKDGVEVTDDGEVIGLLWIGRICGNDPVVWYRRRINLTDLAGAILPEGIEPSRPEWELKLLVKDCKLVPQPNAPLRFDAYSMMSVRRVGKLIDEYLRKPDGTRQPSDQSDQ